MSDINNNKYQVRLPIILMAGMAIGIFIGALISEPSSPISTTIGEMLKFKEVINHIDKDYVDEVNTDELIDAAIDDILGKLDPHTVYIPANDAGLYNSQLQGDYDGVGLQFDIIRDTITVIAPINGGPSSELGIRSGDKIVTVDGENVAGVGITTRDVIEKLRGPKGSEVEIDIYRKFEDDIISFTIERDKIPQNSVDVS